jgi:hypothetical protein
MRKYKMNEEYFDNIQTEEQAYFLGLLLADGHNNVKDGVILIDLQETDINILEKLTALIQPDKPIKNYENKYAKLGRNRVALASRYMSNTLLKFEMVQNKSENLVFTNNIPTELLHHFVRGYFDGNGSIGVFGKVQNVEFSIVSTKEFLLPLQQILVDNCKLNITKLGKRHKDRDSNAYHIKYTGRFSCIKIREWLYKDATVFLERKYKKFFSIPDLKAQPS